MNNQTQHKTPFPSNLEKLALFVAVIPFIFYDWDGTATHGYQGIYNIYALVGGIAAISFVPFIFLLEYKKLAAEERLQHLMLIMAIDTVAIIHILYGLGIFYS